MDSTGNKMLGFLANSILMFALIAGAWFMWKQHSVPQIDPWASTGVRTESEKKGANVDNIVIGSDGAEVTLVPIRPEASFFHIEESAVKRLSNTKTYPALEPVPEGQKGKDQLFEPLDPSLYRF